MDTVDGDFMTSVSDVAKKILEIQGGMTHMKLQKLVYYCQCWSLVWDEAPMFPEKIEAWANGPVVRSLYEQLRGEFTVTADDVPGDTQGLSQDQIDTITGVLNTYGSKRSQWLSDLTHMEKPWKKARKGLAVGERANHEISHASMAEYYGGL